MDREILSFFEDEMLRDGSDIVMESSSTWYHVYELLPRAASLTFGPPFK